MAQDINTYTTNTSGGSEAPKKVTGTDVSSKRALDVNVVATVGGGGGGGTEYTEGATDATITGTAAMAEGSADTLRALQVFELGSAVYPLKTALVDASGNQITSFGGGTQYTEPATDATPTGTVAMGKDASDNILAIRTSPDGDQIVHLHTESIVLPDGASNTQRIPANENDFGFYTTPVFPYNYNGTTWDRLRGDATDGLLVNLGTNNDVTISGTVPLPSGAATLAEQQTQTTQLTAINANTDNLPTALGQTTMAASLPVVIASNQSAVPISAASLPLPTGAATAALQTQPGVDIGDVTINNAAGASAVNIQDGGNSITVDGTVAVSGTVTVDSELPTAAALADATANPTVPGVGNFDQVFNGTTWDRTRTVTNGQNTTGTGIQAAGILGQLDDTATGAVTENQFAPVRISTRRALLVEGVASGTAIPASQSGTWNIGTVTTVTTLANTIVDNAAFTDGTSRVFTSGYIFDEVAGTALTENDAGAARMDSKRAQVLVIEDATTRGTRASVTTPASDSVATSSFTGLTTISGLYAFDGTNMDRVRLEGNTLGLSVGGSVAHDSADAGNPVKIGGKAISVTADPTAVAANDRVDAYLDLNGYQMVKNRPIESASTALTALNDTYDDVTLTNSSADITATGYTIGYFRFTLASSGVGTQTIRFTLEEKSGSNYFPVYVGIWARLIFEDTAHTSATNYSFPFVIPTTGVFRITATADNTTAVLTFTVTNAEVTLRTF